MNDSDTRSATPQGPSGRMTLRFILTGLPSQERAFYRKMRKLGVDRTTANFILYGRLSVHGHGDCQVVQVAQDLAGGVTEPLRALQTPLPAC